MLIKIWLFYCHFYDVFLMYLSLNVWVMVVNKCVFNWTVLKTPEEKQLGEWTRLSLIQQSFSCQPSAMGHPEGWVTCWTDEKPRGTDRGKPRPFPLQWRESLLIKCGRGLLGHLDSHGLVVGAWLWGIWTVAAELVWCMSTDMCHRGCCVAKWLNRFAWLESRELV